MAARKPILLAEDVEDDVAMVQLGLKEAQVTNSLLVASDGVEVISFLKGEGIYVDRQKFPMPEVLLLDLKMPRKDGFEVLEWLRLRPQFDDILVVVLSGFDGIHDVARAYMLGADTFLIKPFRREDIENLATHFPNYLVFSEEKNGNAVK
jgi:CheY-like chemotaxis protein